MQIVTEGLIIKEQTIGESDRLVTVLTRDVGVIRAFARKAKKITDSKSSATQLLCYSRFKIYEGRDKYIINEAFPIEVFFELRTDITKLSLAQYFCEMVAEFIPENVESAEYLRVVLNALHFLSKGTRSEEILKPLAEMRIMTLAGYMPNLVYCSTCGKYEDEHMYFIIGEGTLRCGSCYIKGSGGARHLSQAALMAMRHIIYSDFEKLFSFSVKGEAAKELNAASEEYMLSILQKRLKTLDFYNSVK